jgi:uncharacterized protein YjdB
VKNRNVFNLGVIAVVFMAICTSCKDKEVLVANVVLDKNELTLRVDSTAILTAKVLPDNAADKTVTWTSNNNNVAIVTNG